MGEQTRDAVTVGGVSGRLAGKSAVITGAASGIGRATAHRFIAEGASVVLADWNANALTQLGSEMTRADSPIAIVHGDASDPADAYQMIRMATERFGRLDILVANAGIMPRHTILQASVEEWDAVFQTNGRSMFLTCKAAIEAMSAQEPPGGAIVLTSSISGLAGQAEQAIYGPSKFVASGLTKHLAVDAAKRGVRVNAVAPGTILTDTVRQLGQLPLAEGGVDLDAAAKLHPLGRLGEPDEVAQAIAFLASDDASFITGVILSVDGGYLAQ